MKFKERRGLILENLFGFVFVLLLFLFYQIHKVIGALNTWRSALLIYQAILTARLKGLALRRLLTPNILFFLFFPLVPGTLLSLFYTVFQLIVKKSRKADLLVSSRLTDRAVES